MNVIEPDTLPTDDALATALAAANVALSPAEARSLAAGVAAAPEPDLPGRTAAADWTLLLGRPAGANLEGLLDRVAAAERARFHRSIERSDAAGRLAALRRELAGHGLDGFIVPLADAVHTESLPLRAHRLAWLTGFTGSAGLAIVLADTAALFVDGRYTLQVRDQVPDGLYDYCHLMDNPPPRWLAGKLANGARLGYDPWLHTESEVERLERACSSAGAALVAVPENPVDAIWTDRPPAPLSPVRIHELRFAGEATASKRRRLGEALKGDGTDACVLTAPESVAWLLNIRGGDVASSPLPLAFAILHADAPTELFVEPRKVATDVRDHLGTDVAIRPVDELGAALDGLGAAKRRVRIDPAATAAWIVDRLKTAGADLERGPDPCLLPKACKNAAELAGTRAAHVRDGAALTRFLAWLAGNAPSGGVDELGAAHRLAEFRAEVPGIRGLSFNTIAGAGPNGAIVHYRSTPRTNRRLGPGELFLLDSGAQYPDGTTDVTRTVAIGEPTAEMRDRFTRVLKGHIALAACRFPKGTTGSQLDALARQFLWQAGLDYDHGTGHGVGSYLGVHEGPQRISKVGSAIALEPGMIVSNEPGYYKTGAYGIRIENLVVVVPAPADPAAEKEMLAFETLTRAPIDRTLVDLSLLGSGEIAWLDAFHAQVLTDLAPLLDAATLAWLREAARPLSA